MEGVCVVGGGGGGEGDWEGGFGEKKVERAERKKGDGKAHTGDARPLRDVFCTVACRTHVHTM